MLHNSGAYGPNETPHNASTPVNMSQVTAPVNIGRSLQNMGDIAQQPLRGPTAHYNLPHYSAYDHPNLDMRSNLDAFSKEFHHQYMTQNPTSVHNTRWPNGISPLNLNAQSTYVPNMHNFHIPYDKRQANTTHIPINLKDTKTSEEKTPLNLVESSSKTSTSQDYFYNTNQDVFTDYNQGCQQNAAVEKPTLDISKRRSLENTVRLIETILINTSKENQNSASNTSDIYQNTTNNFDTNKDKQNSANNTTDIFEKMAKTLDDMKQNAETSTNNASNSDKQLENTHNNITKNSTKESNKEINKDTSDTSEQLKTTNDNYDNDPSLNPAAQVEPIIDEPKDTKEIKVKVEIDLESDVESGSEEFQLEFCRDLNGIAKEDIDVTDDHVLISENSIGEATFAIHNGSRANNYYECAHCHLLFNHPKRFLIHAKWHTFGLTNERRRKLARDREFQRKQRREAKIVDQLHKALEEDSTTYPCKDCLKIFCSKVSLKNHRTRFHSGRIRECGVCGAVAMGWAALRAHAATHTSPYKCNTCDKVFRHKHSLARHAETHMDDQEKTLRCELCGKLFATLSRYKEHQRVHIREERGAVYQCSYCAKSFKQAYSLTIHERTHRNEKPFVCDICNSSYGTNSSLKRHMKVSHNRSKPYECAQCKRCFISTKALTGHIARVHSDLADPEQKKRRKKNTKPKNQQKQQQKGAKSKKNKKEIDEFVEERSEKTEDEQDMDT